MKRDTAKVGAATYLQALIAASDTLLQRALQNSARPPIHSSERKLK